jgi:hypothetical protein
VGTLSHIHPRLGLISNQTAQTIEEKNLPMLAAKTVALLQIGVGSVLQQAELMFAEHFLRPRLSSLTQYGPADQVGELTVAIELFYEFTDSGELPLLITSLAWHQIPDENTMSLLL